MMNSKFLPGTKPQIFFLWKRKVFILNLVPSFYGRGKFLFSFSENVKKLSYTAMPNSKISPGTLLRSPDPVLGERRVCFCIRKCTKLSYSNSEFKNFSGTIFRTHVFRKSKLSYCNTSIAMQNSKLFTKLRTFVSGKRKVCFRFSKMYWNSLTTNCFPGTLLRTPVPGKRRVCFCYLKMYQNSPTEMQNSKNLPGAIPRTFVSGEESLFPFS